MKTAIGSIETGIYYKISIKSLSTKVAHMLKQLNFNPDYTTVFINDIKVGKNSRIHKKDKIMLYTSWDACPNFKPLVKEAFPDLKQDYSVISR